MYSKLLGLSVVTALMATTAFAEPQVQPGDSLENLSKVKVSTTVNGQAASLQELVASGQIRIVGTPQNAPTNNPKNVPSRSCEMMGEFLQYKKMLCSKLIPLSPIRISAFTNLFHSGL